MVMENLTEKMHVKSYGSQMRANKIERLCTEKLVELRGIEPLTSAVRLQRSPI